VFAAVMTAEKWTTRKLGGRAGGKREGWWGTRPGAEAFLDQLLTWRELGINMCATRPDDYDKYPSLPEWARTTLNRHRRDRRRRVYTLREFEAARTHDPVWNAAQRQLTRDGWMHNYLRMLWGKKILEWTPAPEDAIEVMTEIMNKHALDGRDPNSYAGYFWTLGRYDRPWAPERPIFGTVRYMSSENTVKKLRMKRFLDEYGRD
jgi:deoxyribodipyrimidine photo-lyase